MKKIGLVAAREFIAAVNNRGFVIGLLVLPILVSIVAFLLPRLMTARGGVLRGEVAVIDRSTLVVDEFRAAIAPAAIEKRREEAAARALAVTSPALRETVGAGATNAANRLVGSAPAFDIVVRPSDTDVQEAKQWLLSPADSGRPRHVAVVVIAPDSVVPAAGRTDSGTYEIYVPANLDDRVESTIYESLREAMLNARIRARGLDRAAVDAMTRVQRPMSVTVGLGRERATNIGFNRALPFIFGMLLLMSIIIGGQSLLTSTIEEKSSRVVEVLLSAVTPVQLMAGKILGQMAVSMLIMVVYVGLGFVLLASFAMTGLLDPILLVYLFLFFVISFLLYTAVFGAVGAAVNEMREAQSLMTPVMMTLVAPWMVGAAIAREPNSTFSVAVSFIPPVNTFAMMMRLSSASPPPFWQPLLTALVGLIAACGVIWVAAKIFKVGLLMHGKPPSFKTLVQWVKQA